MNPGRINIIARQIMLVLVISSTSAFADQFDAQLLSLQAQWADIHYAEKAADKEKRFAALATSAQQFAGQYPDRAEPLVWQGIILSTWAGAKGGLGALSLVKDAKSVLEKSLKIDPEALAGSAYTSLGSLYYQVPGWPIGFGDDKKARAYLTQALAINPQGIDANYFYADYLLAEGDYSQARQYFNKALAASDRPGRLVADNGRRHEIQLKLAELDKKQ